MALNSEPDSVNRFLSKLHYSPSYESSHQRVISFGQPQLIQTSHSKKKSKVPVSVTFRKDSQSVLDFSQFEPTENEENNKINPLPLFRKKSSLQLKTHLTASMAVTSSPKTNNFIWSFDRVTHKNEEFMHRIEQLEKENERLRDEKLRTILDYEEKLKDISFLKEPIYRKESVSEINNFDASSIEFILTSEVKTIEQENKKLKDENARLTKENIRLNQINNSMKVMSPRSDKGSRDSLNRQSFGVPVPNSPRTQQAENEFMKLENKMLKDELQLVKDQKSALQKAIKQFDDPALAFKSKLESVHAERNFFEHEFRKYEAMYSKLQHDYKRLDEEKQMISIQYEAAIDMLKGQVGSMTVRHGDLLAKSRDHFKSIDSLSILEGHSDKTRESFKSNSKLNTTKSSSKKKFRF